MRWGGWRSWHWLGVVGALCLRSVTLAEAPPSSDAYDLLSIEWSAPDGCSSREAMLLEIRRLLGASPHIARPLAAHARIARRDRGTLQLELVVHDDGPATRIIEGASCDALVAAGALIVALAIDPDAIAAQPEPTDAIDEGILRAISGENGEGLSVPGARVFVPASPYREPARPEAPPEPRAGSPRRGRVFAGASVDVGTLPSASYGVDAGAGLRVRTLDLSLAFRWLSKKSRAIDSPPSAGGEFDLLASQLRGCVDLPVGRRFELGPCALAEAGALRGTGFGVVSPRSSKAPWLALGVGGLFRVASPHVAIDLHVDLVAPVTRARYVLDGVGTVYATSPASFRGALQITMLFP